MNFWDKIQQDVKKNIEDVLADVRERGSVVSKKIGKLTEEGKKQLKIFNLNMKVQEELAKLGGHIYDLSGEKNVNPFTNKKVASIISTIKRFESQISRLETASAKKAKPARSKKIVSKAARRNK